LEDNPNRLMKTFFEKLLSRPLSCLTGVFAALLILIPLYQRTIGNVFIEELNYVDGTTLIMVGILLLRGIFSRIQDTDLQAFSIAIVSALSFVFTFEAIYKLSFYAFPWRMPPGELREFVIQVGIALTVLTGFAFDKFRVTKLTWIFGLIFVAGWIFWLLVGFPQLNNGENFYPALVKVMFSWDLIYVLNRALKIVLFLIFYSFYK
jgi:hypothetical protein